jgi:DNA-binding NtrC family response regulator
MAHILIIDDDKHVRTTVRKALEAAGHQVQETSNGREGIKSYEEEPADLILCDLFMPEKEGLETIRELRRQFSGVKIIAMSGGGYAGTMDLLPIAQKFGAAKILRKPFDVKSVLEAVDQVLKNSSRD